MSTASAPRSTLGIECLTALVLGLVGLLLLSGPARAQTQNALSPDITIQVGASAVTTADEDVVIDNQLGIVVLENLGVLPAAAEVIAFGLDVNGDRLISFETTTSLTGGIVARPGDVVRYDGASYSIEFDAQSAGVPRGVMTDAVSLSAGGLLLSFDTTVDLAGLVAADEDLVRWNGASFSMALDGSSAGLAGSLDIDGAQDVGGGSFLLSLDTSGSVGGVDFSDEDVLRYDGAIWSLEIDGSAADSDWVAADVDAVMVPEPGLVASLMLGTTLLATGLHRTRRAGSGRSRAL